MLAFVIRRLGVMLVTALVLTFVVFFLTNLPPNLEKLARSEGSVRMTDAAVASWLEEHGHSGSVFFRYAEWLGSATIRHWHQGIVAFFRATGAYRPFSRKRFCFHWANRWRPQAG